MKINTITKYNFTANVLVPRIQANTSQQVYIQYPRLTGMRVNIVSSRGTTTMFTEKAIEYGARIKQVKNPRGELLFVEETATGLEEYDMHVHQILPVVDVYGNITGYRSTLRQAQPELTNLKDESEG